MTSTGPAAETARAIETAGALSGVLGDLSARLAALSAYGKRSRRVIWLLAVSVVLDITLSAVTVILALGLAGTDHAIRRSQLSACEAGNGFRAGQVALWDHIIAVSSAPPHETPAQREARLARLAAFRAYIAAQFRPADCTRLYGP